MNATYRRITGVAVSLTPILLLLISVAASNDDPLARITNYRQWSTASQDISKDIFTVDPNSVGG